ncbi:PLP-dependent transferase [Punctularia strigosozonata HHB-11173 SS5]|uniref:PLP-dependent transferase n=1 Tax=Punctularia strigosozonata (strain HHB-11173) TaxID=741275 RepID=UPI00044177ED|nr:PLP-dependent transferase [Punctularia strigosozonata HHB-11173 SS5]EIN10771.1 PLP-dependent transferase [Punctularia strigosozonata HHB-11173 SS5]
MQQNVRGHDAIDLSHHLSDLAKSRSVSPLKGLAKYLNNPDLIALAGGMPHPAYFPFSEISGEVLVPDSFALESESSSTSWFWRLFGAGSSTKERTTHQTIPKYPSKATPLNLAKSLQYGTATGLPELQEFLKEFTQKVYDPAYKNYSVLVHAGNTDGWCKAVQTLCNPGEGFLTEDWTYPSALSTARPLGLIPVPVEMDGEGMRADSLRKVLSEWDEKAHGGMKRPHVMYTVPIGQNPSGATMGAARKKAIYDVCVDFGRSYTGEGYHYAKDRSDVIIVEDDPYYFLQEGEYVPKEQRVLQSASFTKGKEEEEYVASLAPSYLKFDTQGRVVRLETFSKTIAPGSRLGWFTCNPVFAERLERQGETSTQSPCGFGQSLITQALLTWKYDGYIRWLRGLGQEYKSRRDHFIDCLADEFQLTRTSNHGVNAWVGCNVYSASDKILSATDEKQIFGRRRYFSFVPPSAGMFIWLKMDFSSHPRLAAEGEQSLEMKLWAALAEAGVLISPGWFFSPDGEDDASPGQGVGHYRISFSNAQFDVMNKAVKIMGSVMRDFFQA